MSELGFYALRLALVVAVAGIGAGLLGGFGRRAEWTEVARRAVLVHAALVTAGLGALFVCFATLDFTLEYVASHAARSMPLVYRMAAVWGGQAGSLLLWAWMLAAYSVAAVIVNRKQTTLMPWVCAVLLGNGAFFLVLLDFVTNPFEKLPAGQVMSDGQGLNPLLQHPVMMIHPIVLYTGMTGFAVPFAFGVAALATGELGSAWLRTTRRWTLWAWLFLSTGILLGGRWAYEVLGWGGYWAWDPVENASFMPWLAGTAYLHSVMVQEKRDMLKTWNLVLVGLTYILCLFGTMLTRSGLVQSVHAFAQTEIFGVLFLGYVVASALLFYGLVLWRRPQLRAPQRLESVLSREAGFVVNNWLFMGLLAIVLWGTLWPKLSEWLSGEELIIGPLWFTNVAAIVALPLLLLTGIGPLVAWRRATPASLRRQLRMPSAVGVTSAALLAVLTRDAFEPIAIVTWALAAFVATTVFQEFGRAIRARMRHGESPWLALATLFRKNQRRYGGYVVHLGVVFLFVGFAGSALNEERLETLEPGEAVELGAYRFEYKTAQAIPAQHHGGAVARIALYEEGRPVATLVPEKRMYWLEQQPSSIPAVYSTLGEDVYVILTAIEADGAATLRMRRNPLVNWIWIGGYTFVLGTALVMWPHASPRQSLGA